MSSAWPAYREAIRRRLGARLTLEQCSELAALLELALAGAEPGPPGVPVQITGAAAAPARSPPRSPAARMLAAPRAPAASAAAVAPPASVTDRSDQA